MKRREMQQKIAELEQDLKTANIRIKDVREQLRKLQGSVAKLTAFPPPRWNGKSIPLCPSEALTVTAAVKIADGARAIQGQTTQDRRPRVGAYWLHLDPEVPAEERYPT